jgi:hypothetical protein
VAAIAERGANAMMSAARAMSGIDESQAKRFIEVYS